VIVDSEGAAAFRDLIGTGKVKQLRDASDRVGGYAMMMTRAVARHRVLGDDGLAPPTALKIWSGVDTDLE
jgi:hypothetical protein